jgi:hypothetical protein
MENNRAVIKMNAVHVSPVTGQITIVAGKSTRITMARFVLKYLSKDCLTAVREPKICVGDYDVFVDRNLRMTPKLRKKPGYPEHLYAIGKYDGFPIMFDLGITIGEVPKFSSGIKEYFEMSSQAVQKVRSGFCPDAWVWHVKANRRFRSDGYSGHAFGSKRIIFEDQYDLKPIVAKDREMYRHVLMVEMPKILKASLPLFEYSPEVYYLNILKGQFLEGTVLSTVKFLKL